MREKPDVLLPQTSETPDVHLPEFKYHPDPLATGSLEASQAVCSCCGQARGFVYAEPILAESSTNPVLSGREIVEARDDFRPSIPTSPGLGRSSGWRGLPPSPVICPWCLADGRARSSLGAEFFDPDSVGGRGRWEDVPVEVVDEIAYRTPGFSGWTEKMWWTHCGDAGVFLGPAGRREVEGYAPELAAALRRECDLTEEEWSRRLATLDRNRGPTAYVFRCPRCGAWGGYVDAPE